MEAEQPQREVAKQDAALLGADPGIEAANDMAADLLEPEEAGSSSADEELLKDGQPDRCWSAIQVTNL